ncbi:predicted protein [Histoplasma capsulatum G186AR]|uniref:Uncharacterized protein n=1 Tax=Ajellomyces capsulatus (strain G186AR / H82 / ATCC MYA-2454 / RMSCC 2432) TaxID=447093 RepID=C0NZL3_AJECG|nr:uncharacterized protein HCBG_08593 [Histoplasma capsulatum G186AR]EEH03261.1 predicted protein [Histoplasma capsulatum G186AR]
MPLFIPLSPQQLKAAVGCMDKLSPGLPLPVTSSFSNDTDSSDSLNPDGCCRHCRHYRSPQRRPVRSGQKVWLVRLDISIRFSPQAIVISPGDPAGSRGPLASPGAGSVRQSQSLLEFAGAGLAVPPLHTESQRFQAR